ncbi:trypsin-like serine peptidase [Fodinicola feengrottensis]|uniref:trypsin-like serine peptidase n=1 Tax=Fodinicola feengrottensis TaxID=435914 RepID=UPI002442AAFA|nr:hypothetical protein [Fodinicola feengrottensis]
MLRFSRIAVVLAVTALASAGVSAAAAAAPTGSAVVRVMANQGKAAAYWTPDRMRHALPGDRLVADDVRKARQNGSLSHLVERGQPQSAQAIAAAPNIAPIAHIGKVFMTLDGTDYVCSGNSVTSGNHDVVATAGHCVKDGSGSWVSNFVFVPDYNNGSEIYGEYSARTVVTTSGWANSGDLNYDTGFAVMAANGSEHVNNGVGASGVAFNQSRGRAYTLYGYPAAPPFNGETLQTCSGTARQDSQGSTDQGVSCTMTAAARPAARGSSAAAPTASRTRSTASATTTSRT